MKNIVLHIDRIEENIIVAFSDDGKKFSFAKPDINIKESDIVLATVNQNGEVVNIKPMIDESKQIKTSLSEKLKKLFKK